MIPMKQSTTLYIIQIGLFRILLPGLLLFTSCAPNTGQVTEDNIFEFRMEPGPDDLFAKAAFRIWIPEGVEQLRGIIVHQHGCGRNGMLMPWDHHWRALARKWDCALMGTHFLQADSCASWHNPLNGSERAFYTALDKFAEQSSHPELKTVPWALWGHSGGAFWVSHMLQLQPERIIAVMARSGGHHVSNPESFKVPVLFNYGHGERPRLNGLTYYPDGREQNAPWLIAPDPVTGHECGNSRLLAIPFFDVCFGLRLPAEEQKALRRVDMEDSWLGDPGSFEITKLAGFQGEPLTMVWLPDGNFARIWQEYVKTGWVTDSTPPGAPYKLSYEFIGKRTLQILWEAEADLESGIKQFYLYRNGKQIKKYVGFNDDYVKKNFQYGNYGDEPGPEVLYENVDKWIPTKMEFVDYRLHPDSTYTYRIRMENWSGLQSEFSEPLVISLSQQNNE
jgi:pimeloyl-ACP methyl ester carboxylesterase